MGVLDEYLGMSRSRPVDLPTWEPGTLARATAESAAHDIRSGPKRRRKKDNAKEKPKGPILVFFMSQIAL
jgi:hypothetical protein